MVRITKFYQTRGIDHQCQVEFELEPIRNVRIFEREVARAIAKQNHKYSAREDGKFYVVLNVGIEHPIERLKEIHEELQEDFSQKIADFRKKVDEFKVIQEVLEKKEA